MGRVMFAELLDDIIGMKPEEYCSGDKTVASDSSQHLLLVYIAYL